MNLTFILQIILWAAAGAFGLLSTIAALTRIRQTFPAPYALMSVGGIGLLGAVIDSAAGRADDWLLALAACGMVCAAAIWNGKRSGHLHPGHHVVRIGLSAVLVAGFILL